MKNEKLLIALAAGAGVAAVVYSLLKKDVPDGAIPVQPFDINRYLGKWYEIARLPNRLEKNIKHLTEDYMRKDAATYKVVTRGYNTKSNEWKEVSGIIKFAGTEDTGKLKVSYLRPFYAAYNVLDIDENYQYALVSGSGLDYLWILSRTDYVPEHIKTRFLMKALAIGFAVDKLEWV